MITEVPRYNRSLIFSFEKDFDLESRRLWLREHLFLPIILGIAYVAMVTKGRELLHKVRPLRLRTPVIIWNIGLATFSIFAAFRTTPELFYSLKHGFHYSICGPKGYMDDDVSRFWIWAGVWMKMAQLLDTVILILRKKEIPFLHMFMHFSYLYAIAFMAVVEIPAFGRWIVCSTYLMQSLVNSYLALRSMDYKLHPKLPMMILLIQIMDRMVILGTSYYMVRNEKTCEIWKLASQLAVTWGIITLTLYSNHYYKKYVNTITKKAKEM